MSIMPHVLLATQPVAQKLVTKPRRGHLHSGKCMQSNTQVNKERLQQGSIEILDIDVLIARVAEMMAQSMSLTCCSDSIRLLAVYPL